MPKTIDLAALKLASKGKKRRVLSASAKKKKLEEERKAATKRRKELREKRLSLGFCGRCGIDPVVKWKRFCRICLENAARMNRDSHKKRILKKRKEDAKKSALKSKTRSRASSETLRSS